MLDADSGLVLRIGVPGVCVSEVLLEERDVELVVSRLRVEVDVEDGVRGSLGERPRRGGGVSWTTRVTCGLRVSTIVLRCWASSQFSTKASCGSVASMDFCGLRRTGSSSGGWGSGLAGSGGSRSSNRAEVSDLMRCWIELNLGSASSSTLVTSVTFPLVSELPVEARVNLAMFLDSGRFFGVCRTLAVAIEEFNEIDRLVLNEADWSPLRWNGAGGRVSGTSAAESVLDSIRCTFDDRLRNFSPNLGSCGAGRVGLAELWHTLRNFWMLAWNDCSSSTFGELTAVGGDCSLPPVGEVVVFTEFRLWLLT